MKAYVLTFFLFFPLRSKTFSIHSESRFKVTAKLWHGEFEDCICRKRWCGSVCVRRNKGHCLHQGGRDRGGWSCDLGTSVRQREGLSKVHVESDCLRRFRRASVVTAVSAHLIKSICSSLSFFADLVFTHTRHEGNATAHCLATNKLVRDYFFRFPVSPFGLCTYFLGLARVIGIDNLYQCSMF